MDRRVRKTQQAITKATVELLLTTPINRLTIKEICNKADISRSTFYLHYYDASDVIEQLYNDITINISKLLDKYDFAQVLLNPENFIVAIVDFIKQNSSLYSMLLLNDYHSDFRRRLKNMLQKKVLEDNYYRYRNKEMYEITICYIMSGLVETICDHLDDINNDKCGLLVETLIRQVTQSYVIN